MRLLETNKEASDDFLSKHHISIWRLIAIFIFGIIAVGEGCFIIDYNLSKYNTPPLPMQIFPFSAISNSTFITIGSTVLAIIMIPYGLWLTVSSLRTLWQHPQIKIYEQAISVDSRSGQKTWQWNEFDTLKATIQYEKVWDWIPLGYFGAYTLYCEQRPGLRIDYHYQAMKQLQDTVLFKTGEVLWPKYATAYERGERLGFGKKVNLNNWGITYRNQFFAWKNITGWKVDKNDLLLDYIGAKTPISIQVHGLPNAHILLMLIDAIVNPDEASTNSSDNNYNPAPLLKNPYPNLSTQNSG